MIEANVIRTLEAASDYIVDFDAEKFMIPYAFKTAQLNYVPDFIFKTTTGKVYILEVKPSSQLEEEKNVAKWEAASAWAWQRGAKFLVTTDKDWPNLIEALKAYEANDKDKVRQLLEWKCV